MRISAVLILSILVFTGCNSNKLPADILPPKKMQDVLWDIMQADSYTYNYLRKDSFTNAVEENAKLKAQVFLLHKTNKEVFEKSYTYYSEHPDLMNPLLDSIQLKKNPTELKRNQKEHTPAALDIYGMKKPVKKDSVVVADSNKVKINIKPIKKSKKKRPFKVQH